MENSEIRRLYLEAAAKQLKARTSVLAQIETFESGWQTGWMHRDVCAHLDGAITAVDRKSIVGGPRMTIELPPGVGKTLMVGNHLIANTIGRHPDWQIIYGTYNFDKAAEVGRDTRNKILDPRFQEIHPNFSLDRSAQSMDYMLTDRGGKVSFVGVEGGGMGKRAHLFVVDDPFKNEEEGRSETHQEKVFRWIMATVLTRLHPEGAVIVMHQRWHTYDLIGRLKALTASSPNVDQYYSYRYPMEAETDETHRKRGEPLHPERFSQEWMARRKATLIAAHQEWTWAAMYQQNPILDTGMCYKRDWFQFCTLDQIPKNVTWGVTTDFAATAGGGDASVARPFCVDANHNMYYFDPFHAHVDPNVAQEATFNIVEEKKAYLIFVEKGVLWNANKSGYREQMAKRGFYPRVIEFTRTRKKREHSSAQMGHMSQKKVFFLDTPFNRTVALPQYMAFTGEQGANEVDDIVDADSLPFLSWNQIPIPDAEVTLPEPDEIPELNRQILANMGKKKKPNRHSMFAGDVEPGTFDETADDEGA